jgi:hypothetical protein
MLKLLQNWDRKLESFIHEMDRTLQEPVTRTMTFDVFRDNGAHRARAAEQPVTAVAAVGTNGASEITANTSSAPASPGAVNPDYNWDYYPAPDGSMSRDAVTANLEREGCLSCP